MQADRAAYRRMDVHIHLGVAGQIDQNILHWRVADIQAERGLGGRYRPGWRRTGWQRGWNVAAWQRGWQAEVAAWGQRWHLLTGAQRQPQQPQHRTHWREQETYPGIQRSIYGAATAQAGVDSRSLHKTTPGQTGFAATDKVKMLGPAGRRRGSVANHVSGAGAGMVTGHPA